MWLIGYQYKKDDGSIANIRSPIKDGKSVTIGRSNQCALHIKNDKSISRKHIQFTCERLHESFTVENFGKVTAYNNHYLKVGQKVELTFNDITKPLQFSLGTAPVNINVESKICQIIVFKSLVYEVQEVLKNYYIDITTDPILYPTSFTYVLEDKTIPLLHLYAAIAKLPVVSKLFIDGLITGLQNNCSDIDVLLTQLLNQNPLNYPSITHSIENMTFIYLNKDLKFENNFITKLTSMVQKIGGNFLVYDSDEKFKSYLQLRNSLENIVIIRHQERILDNSVVEILGKQTRVYSTVEFLNVLRDKPLDQIFVKKVELNHISESKAKPESKPIQQSSVSTFKTDNKQRRVLEEPIEPSPIPTKKKRLTRRKVQPLNPLELFAGGSQSELKFGAELDSIRKSPTSPPRENESTTSVEPVSVEKSKVNQKLTPLIPQSELKTNSQKQDEVIPLKTNSFVNRRINSITQKEDEPLPLRKTPSFFDHKIDAITKDNHESQISSNNKNSIINSFDYKKDKGMDQKLRQSEPVQQNDKDSSIGNKETRKHYLDSISDENGKLIKVDTSSEDSVLTKKRKVASKKEKESKNVKDIKIENGMTVRKPTLVETIQSTKNKEIDRFRNNMVQVAPEELTEDAINEFSALSIVVETDSTLLRSASNNPSENNRENGTDIKYKNRPNYKKFVKRRAHGSSDSKDSLRCNVDMLTRQFIETKPYSTMDKYTSKRPGDVGEDINEVFANRNTKSVEGSDNEEDEVGDIPPPMVGNSIESTTKQSRKLFHQSDDQYDSEDEGPSFPATKKVPQSKVKQSVGLFIQSSDEEDSQDRVDPVPTIENNSVPSNNRQLFSLSSDNEEDNNGMIVSNQSIENSIIDTVRDQPPVEQEPSKSNPSRSFMSLSNTISNDDSDDDDDSDEGPKFQFKSRK